MIDHDCKHDHFINHNRSRSIEIDYARSLSIMIDKNGNFSNPDRKNSIKIGNLLNHDHFCAIIIGYDQVFLHNLKWI